MKKLISLTLALILALTALAVPAMAETVKVGELAYLNSDGTLRSGMLTETMKAILSYTKGSFYFFGKADAVEAVEFDNLNSMLMALQSGTIDQIIVYSTIGKCLIEGNDDLTSWDWAIDANTVLPSMFLFILDQLLGTNFSFLMLEDHAALRDEFNQAIADMKADGTLDELTAAVLNSSTEMTAAEITKIDGAETIKMAVTGDLPPMDYIDEAGIPTGFNTAVLAEISKRIGKNIELVSIDAGARSSALASGAVDVVFWSRIGSPREGFFDSLPEEQRGTSPTIVESVTPYHYTDIDIPEGMISTDAFFHDIYIPIFLKK